MPARRLPIVVDDQLQPASAGATVPIVVGSPAWQVWLADPAHRSFSYHAATGAITVRREQVRNGWYWYAYRTAGGKTRKVYLGRAAELTPERLRAAPQEVAPDLAGGALAARLTLLGPPRLARNGQ
ncbi:MAG: hypothetical protein ACTHMR_16125, partial [Thermomicrobiales bacterium]